MSPELPKGNNLYTVSAGDAVWAPRCEQNASAVEHWPEHPEEHSQAVAACRRLARPQAAHQVASILVERLGRPVR